MKSLPAWVIESLVADQGPLHEMELDLDDATLEYLRRQHERSQHAEDDGNGNVTVLRMPDEDCAE